MRVTVRYLGLLALLAASVTLMTLCTARPPAPTAIMPEASLAVASQDVKVAEIKPQESTFAYITQVKTIDQCASASPFKFEAQFSQVTSEQVQDELVLRAEAGGEAGISPVARVTLKGGIEERFRNTSDSQQNSAEKANFEVPGHTKQEYTIIWRETRRAGQVEYLENGQRKLLPSVIAQASSS
jgi:hypothetical protein